jgi:putative transposase
MPDFHRKSNRLPRGSYIGHQWYFITLNAEDGQPILGKGKVVSLLIETLRQACMQHMFDIYAYCFMPNHVHIEPAGLASKSDLVEFMRTWKGTSTVPLRGLGLNDPFQKCFYDHILRPDDNQNAVAWYIFNNPVRKGLVKDARDWPYSGSWMFDWKKAVAPPEEFVPPRWRDKPAATLPES